MCFRVHARHLPHRRFIASDSPLVIDQPRWRSILRAYAIDGRPAFDLATASGRSEMAGMPAVANAGRSHRPPDGAKRDGGRLRVGLHHHR